VRVGRSVAVIGGGNTAIDAARSALRLGAKEVVLIYRRSKEEMPAYIHEVEAVEKEKVKIIIMAMPTRILNSSGKVSGVECLKTGFSGIHQGARRGVQPLPGTDFEIRADTIIVSIGESSDLSFLPRGVKTKSSLVSVDLLGGTSRKGLFAGGDLVTFDRSVASAIASGKRAALGIHRFLQGDNEAAGDAKRRQRTILYEDLHVDFFTKSPSVRAKDRTSGFGVSDFQELDQGLSVSSAAKEAWRCFQCGVCTTCGNCYIFCPEIAITPDEEISTFDIRSDVCKECGICLEVCPRGAIQWRES
jgi:NADPH-dependent glutamate synthase beta subunit-like oxidoreductase